MGKSRSGIDNWKFQWRNVPESQNQRLDGGGAFGEEKGQDPEQGEAGGEGKEVLKPAGVAGIGGFELDG